MTSPVKLRDRRRQATSDRDLWRLYVDGGRVDDELRNLLIGEVLPVAQGLAKKVHLALARLLPLEDLEQEAAIGLIESAARYDPQRGVSFRSFSYSRMMGRMLDAARDRDELSRNHRQLVKQRQAFEEEHLQRHGSRPASHVVCEALGWSERRYMQTYTQLAQSLDQAVYEGENSAIFWRDLLADGAEDPKSRVQFQSLVRSVLLPLDLDDQFLVWAYLCQKKTMRQIASFLEISESRVSQRFKMLKPQLMRWIATQVD